MPFDLRWRGATRLPVDGRGLCARRRSRPLSPAERGPLAAPGRQRDGAALGELFRIEGDAATTATSSSRATSGRSAGSAGG